MRVTLFGKPDCKLCDIAERLIRGIDPTLAIEKVDITGDPQLFERYRNEIPVVAVDGVVRLRGRITTEALRAALGCDPS